MKTKGILLLLIPGLLLTSCNSELLPSVLASATQDNVEQVKADSDDVFTEIQRNIDMVSALKTKVQEAQMDGSPIALDSVIKDIEKVAQSYENLAGQRENIRKGILRKIERVQDMQIMVDVEIKTLRERRSDYANRLRLVSDPNPDIARTRKEALEKACGYVDSQILLWKNFNSIEWDILIEMSDIQRTIDRFLAMIESTSLVYREGLNLLYLQKDINEAIALFASDIPRMEQLTSDMQKSWDSLDFLLETLTGISTIGITQ